MMAAAGCVAGWPVAVSIPEFIGALAQGDIAGAAGILQQDNALPAVCGRVCPQESQCEAKCVRGVKGESVAIGYLERFVADWAIAEAKRQTCRRRRMRAGRFDRGWRTGR